MRILVLISGNGSNLQRLIDNVHNNDNVQGEIVGVISNKKHAYGLTRAENVKIQTDVVEDTYTERNITYRKNNVRYEEDLCQLIDFYSPDLIVLAGWMYIMGDIVLNKYSNRMINLHPALPNSYVGAHCIEQAWESYQKGEIMETGVMTHWVTKDLDRGDCIQSLRIPIHGCNNLSDLKERICKFDRMFLR